MLTKDQGISVNLLDKTGVVFIIELKIIFIFFVVGNLGAPTTFLTTF